jgi:hypothetical protein
MQGLRPHALNCRQFHGVADCGGKKRANVRGHRNERNQIAKRNVRRSVAPVGLVFLLWRMAKADLFLVVQPVLVMRLPTDDCALGVHHVFSRDRKSSLCFRSNRSSSPAHPRVSSRCRSCSIETGDRALLAEPKSYPAMDSALAPAVSVMAAVPLPAERATSERTAKRPYFRASRPTVCAADERPASPGTPHSPPATQTR